MARQKSKRTNREVKLLGEIKKSEGRTLEAIKKIEGRIDRRTKKLEDDLKGEVKGLRDGLEKESKESYCKDFGAFIFTLGALLFACALSFDQLELLNLFFVSLFSGFFFMLSGIFLVLGSRSKFFKGLGMGFLLGSVMILINYYI